jgi:hypothetical protein
MTKTPSNYEERVVLFLDILGFKELINESIEETKTFEQIKTSIRVIREVFKITEKTKERTITQFSDSIAISFLTHQKGEVAFLLAKTQELIKKLILKGIVCRGGIAKGKLVHNDTFLFGPAFNEAYKLESKVAIFPRVIIDDRSILDIGIENFGYHPANDPKQEESEINSIISVDFDGLHFINYFNFETVWEMSEKEKLYLHKLNKLIVNQLIVNDNNQYVKKKYEWMRDKFNIKINKLKADNRIVVGGFNIGSDKRSKFYKTIKNIE